MFHQFSLVGCKIKALRAKTNTYIKTPVRGEEPTFVITGRPEDVSVAKKEILQAADHFSQIRASRKSSCATPTSVGSTLNGNGGSSEEKITIFVRVPYRVVGLVVGPKGTTVKRIQQSTGTYIVTPSRDMEPYFEVRGPPENVEQAKKEIESYIALRTGGSFDQVGTPTSTTATNSITGGGNGLVHCIETSAFSETGVQSSARRSIRRTMSVSETSNLYPGSVQPSTPTISESVYGGKTEHRSSPLSSAVFSSGTYGNFNDDFHHQTVPMSAPAQTFSKVFDFGSNRLKHYSPELNGSWSQQQPSNPLPNSSSWGLQQFYNQSTLQPSSPTGSWGGSSGGKLSPQPPSPTGSWGSNSSEGNAVMSPRGFPGGFQSSQGYSQFSRQGYMQQSKRTNTSVPLYAGQCCYCEHNEADTIFVPCGHKTTCFECACRLSSLTPVCPSCSSNIESLAQQLCA